LSGCQPTAIEDPERRGAPARVVPIRSLYYLANLCRAPQRSRMGSTIP